MSAVQLPHDVRGEALCRHEQPGACTWWCSYRRAVLCIGPLVVLLIVGGVIQWTAGDVEARDRVVQTVMGVSVFLAVTVPVVLWCNHADERR